MLLQGNKHFDKSVIWESAITVTIDGSLISSKCNTKEAVTAMWHSTELQSNTKAFKVTSKHFVFNH